MITVQEFHEALRSAESLDQLKETWDRNIAVFQSIRIPEDRRRLCVTYDDCRANLLAQQGIIHVTSVLPHRRKEEVLA